MILVLKDDVEEVTDQRQTDNQNGHYLADSDNYDRDCEKNDCAEALAMLSITKIKPSDIKDSVMGKATGGKTVNLTLLMTRT